MSTATKPDDDILTFGWVKQKAGPVWNGQVRLNHDWLLQPLQWKKPRRIFVCAHGDLFHENVPDAWIDQVFAVMALAPQHTFQVLTKRSGRMREYLSTSGVVDKVIEEVRELGRAAELRARAKPSTRRVTTVDQIIECDARAAAFNLEGGYQEWPLKNVWLGVSTEDQQRANERRDDLAELAKQGWTTFASYEPALELIDWSGWEFLSQLISGGESGRGARPSHPDWHLAARDFCDRHGIGYFFKQWGAWAPRRKAQQSDLVDARKSLILSRDGRQTSGLLAYGDDAWVVDRVGKAAAGRLLDGVEHNGMPEARA